MLHDYQKEVVATALERKRAALFLDMGLGKTAIILNVISKIIETDPNARFIVIAPPALVLHSWSIEIRKFTPHLTYLNDFNRPKYSPKDRLRVYHSSPYHHILLLSYSLVLKFCTEEVLQNYKGLVIDESSKFKGYKNKSFCALKRSLGHFEYRYVMTGTPIPNGYMDIYNQVYFIDEGAALGDTFYRFRSKYYNKDPWNRFSYTLRPGAEEEIKKAIAPLIIHKGTESLPPDTLPPYVATTLHRQLPTALADGYNALKKQYMITVDRASSYIPSTPLPQDTAPAPVTDPEGYELNNMITLGDSDPEDIIAKTEADLASKLLQYCSGAVYREDGSWVELHNVKMDLLDEVLQHYPGRVLLAINYRHEASRILARFGSLITTFDTRHTSECLEKWERAHDTEGRVLLAHPASVGYGLNLQHCCNIIVWFGFTWNLEHYLQFNKRLHRQGQRHPVRCIHLAVGDIEYKLLNRLQQKDVTQRDLLGYMRTAPNEPTYEGFYC